MGNAIFSFVMYLTLICARIKDLAFRELGTINPYENSGRTPVYNESILASLKERRRCVKPLPEADCCAMDTTKKVGI